MGPKSLFQLSKELCVKNINRKTKDGRFYLEHVSDAPYEMVKPILRKVENPDHLRTIEENSPQLLGETGDLWLAMIKRDIPNWQNKPHEPQNAHNWWKVYRHLRKLAAQELEDQEAALRAAFSTRAAERDSKRTTVIERAIDPTRKRKRPPAPSHGVAGGNPSVLSFAGGSRTKLRTGKEVLERARREAREAMSTRTRALATPTHLLAGRARGVLQAPKTMVEGYARGRLGGTQGRQGVFALGASVEEQERVKAGLLPREKEKEKEGVGISGPVAVKRRAPPGPFVPVKRKKG